MVFSGSPPSDTVKFENVSPAFSNLRPFVFILFPKPNQFLKTFVMTSTVHFSNVRQLLVDFQ